MRTPGLACPANSNEKWNMKLDKEMGANDAPAAGAEWRFEETSPGASPQEGRGTRGGSEVWKQLMIPFAT